LLTTFAGNSVPHMKSILAAFVLLLQLYPLLGTAACLGRASQRECPMPEHGAVPHGTVAQTEPATPNCALAFVCAPSPLAIVSLPENLESIIALHSESPIMATAALFGISSAPPFHPPRA
jgi:hypothetical protein